jgi:autoinducer 2-degrading protein
MIVLHVNILVKPEHIEAFKDATMENARHSRKEPGIARFDLLQQKDDPTRFLLVEVYRTPEAIVAHKATAHWAAWRDCAEPLIAEPRTRMQYINISPGDDEW